MGVQGEGVCYLYLSRGEGGYTNPVLRLNVDYSDTRAKVQGTVCGVVGVLVVRVQVVRVVVVEGVHDRANCATGDHTVARYILYGQVVAGAGECLRGPFS